VVVFFTGVPVPGCTDHRTVELALQILRDQLHISGDLSLQHIRTESGGIFAHKYECAADVRGITKPSNLLDLQYTQIYYTSEVTEDTHRHYVTARMTPIAK
jgi:hypothetical protein